jgi:integrase
MKAAQRKRYLLPDEILTESEVEALLQVCSPQSSTGLRNRALITVLYRGGLRLGEALRLRPSDVDPQRGQLHILNSKTDQRRVVRLDADSFGVLTRWLERRQSLQLDVDTPIFSTLAGEAIKQAYVRALLPRLARCAGIHKRCHAHALRHTHAAELARRLVPIDQIQRQLGHASRASTIRYIASVQGAESTAQQQSASW